MIPNVKPSKLYPYKEQIAPQSVAAGATVTSGWFDAAEAANLKIAALVGAGAGTFAVKVEQATSSGGAGAKDLVATGITALATGHAEADVALGAALDVDGAFRYVRVSATCTGGAGTLFSAQVEAGPATYAL